MNSSLTTVLVIALGLGVPCATAEAAPLQDTHHPKIETANPKTEIATSEAILSKNRGFGTEAGLVLPQFDEPCDGSMWVLGTNFKARFDARGLEFVPYLGSDAPRNYPITFSIGSARVGDRELAWNADVAPERVGSIVTYHRGAFDEIFEVGADSIEHKFLFDERVGGGDLILRIRTEGELERTSTELGTCFSNDRGAVTYGNATLVDSRARTIGSVTQLVGDSIVIFVPACELERAEFPLTVDPQIRLFQISDNQGNTVQKADVSYDLTTNTYLCVYESVFSQSDHDIFARQLDGLGNVIPGATTFIDISSDDWQRPRVANNNAQNQFMVVAERHTPSALRGIWARTRSATSTAMSGQFFIVLGFNSYWYPDIGGDSYPNGTPAYCVVWEENYSTYSSGVWLICYRLVSPNGILLGSGTLATTSNGATKPSISKSNGTWSYGNSRWSVVWNITGDATLYWAQIAPNGSIVTKGNQVNGTGTNFGLQYWTDPNDRPSVSSLFDEYKTNRRFLVAYVGRVSNNDYRIKVVEESLDYDSTGGGPRPVDLDWIGRPQHAPRVEYDGLRALVSFQEETTASNQDVFVSSVSPDGAADYPVLVEKHLFAGFAAVHDLAPSICSKHSSGGLSKDCMTVWHREAGLGLVSAINGLLHYAP